MNKLSCFIFLICFIFVAGCTDSLPYNDEDVAAIVRGEEITIGDLRFLYPDEDVLDMIEGTVKGELVVQEAKDMDIDVSEDVEETMEIFGEYPSEDIGTAAADSIREFTDPQAKKLGIDPEEYYEKYMKKTTETGAYINAYIKEMLGKPPNGVDAFDEQANQLLDDLMEENEAEIRILIK